MTAPNAAEARRIDHIGIAVADVEASAGLLVERFGLRVSQRADLEDGSARLLYLEAGDTTVQLVQPLRPGPLADFLTERGEGLHHICFVVDHLEDALDALSGERGTSDRIYLGGRRCRVVFTATPLAGVLVELTEPAAIPLSEP